MAVNVQDDAHVAMKFERNADFSLVSHLIIFKLCAIQGSREGRELVGVLKQVVYRQVPPAIPACVAICIVHILDDYRVFDEDFDAVAISFNSANDHVLKLHTADTHAKSSSLYIG